MRPICTFDLGSGALRRLTRDASADLQPAWSPDGRTIAFASDGFTSSLDSLTFGAYRLAALDLESGDVRELPSLANAKNIDPQWIGQDLVFISDVDRVSNVFRLDMQSGAVRQLTNERSGVSGITSLSPALSVAAGAGRLVYSVYKEGGYEIRTMPLAGGWLTATALSRPAADVGPPAAALAPVTPAAATPIRYRGRLALNSIGQPYLSAGGGALGGFFRAGMSISFSDLLEQRQLQTAVQVGTRARDFAVQTAFVNKQSRWTWGLLGAQLPVGFVSTRTRPDGSAGVARDTESFRQTHRQAMAMIAYPFSRVRRVELTTGLHSIAFDRELRTRHYDGSTGELVAERDRRLPAPGHVALVESAAALVYDSSVAGPTAPVLGQRSRFEIAPTFGDLSYITMTADYRRYLMPARPFTLALRAQHVGRYGADAADGRLLPLVWTVRDLVRGYTMRDAVGRPCSANVCDPLSEAAVRRLFVANVELRAPLLGPLGLLSESAAVPLDAFLFADAGSFERGLSGDRSHATIRTVGAGARLNATGFIFEFAAARTLDRGDRGWTLAVNFRPGF